jgi:hypothetical protein
MAVLVGAHVRTRQPLVWLVIISKSSTLMVLVFPVPGGPHMRLKLFSPLFVAEMQLSMASACEPLS